MASSNGSGSKTAAGPAGILRGWPGVRLPGLGVLLLAGLALRLVLAYVVLPHQGLVNDLGSFDRWALALADHGPGGYWANAGFADYPPGYLYFLWPIGIIGRALSGIIGQPAGEIAYQLLKLPAIFADLAIAVLLLRAVSRWHGAPAGGMAAALYLFIPVTWYESAAWGQMDSVGMLFLLGALLLLLEGWSEASVAVAVLAVLIKPQYAIGLAVIGPILLRRHLLVRGSGPVPLGSRVARAIDDRLGGWFTRRQGFERLVACAVVAVLAFILPILPFDLPRLAPPELAGVPVVGSVAGLLAMLGSLAAYYPVLTANAFNAWALVGPEPLSHELSRTFHWTPDSLPVLGSVPAVTVGAILLIAVTVIVAIPLFFRDDRRSIVIAFTVLAFAFFALPTRVHERYQFPVFVTMAVIAAVSVRWRWWYVALGLLTVINLHAVLTLARPGFASAGLIGAPLGDWSRSDAVVIVASLGQTVLFLAILAFWAREALIPTIGLVWARLLGRRAGAPAVRPAIPDRPAVAGSAAKRPVAAATAAGTSAARASASAAGTAAATAAVAATGAGVPRGRPRAVDTVLRPLVAVARPINARLSSSGPPEDRTAGLATEGAGRIDRRDLVLALLIVAATFGTRIYRIDTPRTMYFDELYYPSTGAEFLRDWRYGIEANIFEWTHPHVSKYVMGASIALFGDDRVTGSVSVGAPVVDVAFQPAYPSSLQPGGYGGDQIALATGSDVRIAIHGVFPPAVTIPIAGATHVAFDRVADRLYVGTADGTIWAVDCSLMDAAAEQGSRYRPPAPVRVANVGAPVTGLWAPVRGRVIAGTGGDHLVSIDGKSGARQANRTLPGFAGLVPIVVSGKSLVAVADETGVEELDVATLQTVAQTELSDRPTGIDLVDGSQFGWANQDTLPVPTLYVSLTSSQVQAVQVPSDGTIKTWDTFPMPGPVSAVHWDRPSNMVHIQGLTPDGRPTIYVVEPHTDAVFADAALPFAPVAWTLDVQPDTPSLDRQRALVFPASGDGAVVDVGSHAFAWRLPGVLAGALTAGLMFLLARMLFRRKSVAYLLAGLMALDGFLFSQGRIAMNDSLLGFFMVAAITLLAALFHYRGRRRWSWLIPALGLPAVGVLLGLAFATKWIGAYAMGACLLLVLAQSPIGRKLALLGLIGLTGIFGYQAVAGDPPNYTFFLIMLGLTAVSAVLVARDGVAARDAAGSGVMPPSRDIPDWLNPRHRFGVPFGWALFCIAIVPVVVYVITFIPWALAASGGPQLLFGWPPGHTGQTFMDLQAQMYAYHNDLRNPHGESSPWWAWPFGLRPIWGYYNTFSDGSQSLILLVGNPILQWLSVPAAAFGAWQAWRRRSWGLAFVLIVFLSLWLAWARIDRVAFNYHYYTTLMFGYVLLAYFLAELWEGPSRRTWNLARVAFAAVLAVPALMWIFRDPLCAVANVAERSPQSFACTRSVTDLAVPLGLWLIGAAILGWIVLGASRPRRLVAGVLAAGGVAFAVLFPAFSAWQIPHGWPLIYQGLLPTWDISFAFGSNTQPSTVTPLLGVGAALTLLVAGTAAWLILTASGGGPDGTGGTAALVRTVQSLLRRGRPMGPVAPPASRTAALVAPAAAVASTDAPSANGIAGSGLPASARPDAGVRRGQDRASATVRPRSMAAAISHPPMAHVITSPPAVVLSRPRLSYGRFSAIRARLTARTDVDSLGIPVVLFLVAVIGYAVINHGRPARVDYFVPLADAFLHGQLGLSARYSWFNEVVFGLNNLYNVVYPPAPAILLMPLVAVAGAQLEQSWVSIALGAANVALMSIVLAQMRVGRVPRVVFSLAFAFGTIVWYSAQIGTAWHFAHVVSITFMLLAILACQRDLRAWAIGLLFAAAVLTRFPIAGAAPFFLAYAADRVVRRRTGDTTPFGAIGAARPAFWRAMPDAAGVVRLIVPAIFAVAVPVLLDMVYNLARFGSPFQVGYDLIPGLLGHPPYTVGITSLTYIPGTLSAMFLSGAHTLSGIPWFQPFLSGGPSILLTTPFFLWAFANRRLDWFTLGAASSILLTLAPIVVHGGTGDIQFGFRFAQDFYPLLFLLAVRGAGGRITRFSGAAMAAGFVVNAWGMAAAYQNWWG